MGNLHLRTALALAIFGVFAAPLRIHRLAIPSDHALADPVFHVGFRIGRTPQRLAVGLVFREEQLGRRRSGGRGGLAIPWFEEVAHGTTAATSS